MFPVVGRLNEDKSVAITIILIVYLGSANEEPYSNEHSYNRSHHSLLLKDRHYNRWLWSP